MKKKIASVVIGLLFILGAAAYVANHFFGLEGVTPFFSGWWTVFIIVPAALGLFRREGRVFSVSLLLLGLCLLAKYQPWFPVISSALAQVSVWHMIVAVGLLFIGLTIIVSGFSNFNFRVHFDPDGSDDTDSTDKSSASNIFGERCISFDGQKFTGYDINSIFGEFTLDLRGAIIENNCTINVSSVFGSVVIISGNNAVFSVGKNTVFGAVECKSSASDPSLPVITVKADAVFGSVEIK